MHLYQSIENLCHNLVLQQWKEYECHYIECNEANRLACCLQSISQSVSAPSVSSSEEVQTVTKKDVKKSTSSGSKGGNKVSGSQNSKKKPKTDEDPGLYHNLK